MDIYLYIRILCRSGASTKMHETFRFVITEHAAWRITEGGRYRVFALSDGGQWLVRVKGGEVLSCLLVMPSGEPRCDVFALPRPGVAGRKLPSCFQHWQRSVPSRGSVRPICGKHSYRDYPSGRPCRAGQTAIPGFLPGVRPADYPPERRGVRPLPPSRNHTRPARDQFASVGLTFERRPLRAAAEAYLKHGAHWRDLPRDDGSRASAHTAYRAVDGWRCRGRLQQRFHVLPLRGPGRPHLGQASRAVISMARYEQALGRLWQRLAGDQLATLTLLTLAWGSQHGDTG